MDSLIIKATKDTPSINFDTNNNKFSIEGNSLPENAVGFYKPVFDWLTEFIEEKKEGFELLVDINYLNSSSVKFVFAFFMKLDEAYKKANSESRHKIVWKFRNGDELMEQKGKEFKSFLEVPFETTSY